MFETGQTEALRKLKDQLGNLIVDVKPTTSSDWKAFKKMVASHDNLSTIDYAKLSQKSLIETETKVKKE